MLDDACQLIVNILCDAAKKGNIHNNSFADAQFDVSLDKVVEQYMRTNNIPSIGSSQAMKLDCGARQKLEYNISSYKATFSDALWELCRRGILRPGEHFLDYGHKAVSFNGDYFSVTTFGNEWLSKHGVTDLLPVDLNRFIQLFDNFQSDFGVSYFRRAKEAVHCFQVSIFLACCVMAGAATEAILLSVAFLKEDKNIVLKQYLASRGRSNVEKLVFGQTDDYIKKRYQKYTDIISYWRDESGHGHESDIDVNEAYIALLTLLRFAEFIRDHRDEIVKK